MGYYPCVAIFGGGSLAGDFATVGASKKGIRRVFDRAIRGYASWGACEIIDFLQTVCYNIRSL